MNDIKSVQNYFTVVKNLFARQKLVGNLVHRQDMPQHDLAEYLIHKQNLNELETPLDRFEKPDVARILEALVSGSVRVELVSEPSQRART